MNFGPSGLIVAILVVLLLLRVDWVMGTSLIRISSGPLVCGVKDHQTVCDILLSHDQSSQASFWNPSVGCRVDNRASTVWVNGNEVIGVEFCQSSFIGTPDPPKPTYREVSKWLAHAAGSQTAVSVRYWTI